MAKKVSNSAKKRVARRSTASELADKKNPSKSVQVIELLRRPTGASIAELMKATGWQAHSVRGFISGTLKRKQGMVVSSSVEEGKDRRYTIAGAA